MIPEFILTLANASNSPHLASNSVSRANTGACRRGQVIVQETDILDYTKKPPFPLKAHRHQVWGCLTLGQPPHWVPVQSVTIQTSTPPSKP